MIEKDKLDDIYLMQLKLQKELYKDKEIIWNQQYIEKMILGLQNEINEALTETPWKLWKKNQTLNKQKFRNEIIDCWHFLINLTIAADLNPDTLFYFYQKKNIKNKERIINGY